MWTCGNMTGQGTAQSDKKEEADVVAWEAEDCSISQKTKSEYRNPNLHAMLWDSFAFYNFAILVLRAVAIKKFCPLNVLVSLDIVP